MEPRRKTGSLEATEEYELLRRAKAGDDQAKMALITAHTPYIRKTINDLTMALPKRLPMQDLMQEGVIGMLDAIERFELERGLRFLTYAYWRIRKQITSFLTEMGYAAKIPFPDVVKLKKLVNKLAKANVEATDADRPFKVYLVAKEPTDDERKAGQKPRFEYVVAGPHNVHPAKEPLFGAVSADEACQLIEDQHVLDEAKNVQILELVLGCLSIHPTEHGAGHEDEMAVGGMESRLMTPDASTGAMDALMEEEIAEALVDLSIYDGTLMGLLYGLAGHAPRTLREIAGERSRLVKNADGSWDVLPGTNGLGLQLGESYNAIGKAIKLAETKLKNRLRKSETLSGSYGDLMRPAKKENP